ncbi:MAG TPA: hypothetical protein VF939_20705 [Puia sp.]
MQKYSLEVSGIDSTDKSTGFSYYHYGSTVPSYLPFTDQSEYILNSTQPNNFSVSFPTVKPSYYETVWGNGKVELILYAPPTTTQLQPTTELAAMKSRLLAGQDISNLSFYQFVYENAEGKDYGGFFNYEFNADLLQKERLPSSIRFSKTY